MAEIVFIDGHTPHPYTHLTPLDPECRLGGAELSVLDLAEELRSHKIVILQYGREEREWVREIEYRSLTDVEGIDAKYVIILRLPEALPILRHQWPKAKLVLWLHDQHDASLSKLRPLIDESQAQIVVGTDYHKQRIEGFLGEGLQIHVIPLPIKDELVPLGVPYNANKLVFASSPTRDLKNILKLFARGKALIETLELHVFNPGYTTHDFPAQAGVYFRGRVPQRELWNELGEALCLFFPQYKEPESFGRVFAESHALGTPVLAHPFGSAPELLSKEELVDCRDGDLVLKKLFSWYSGERPRVQADPRYRSWQVTEMWRSLLDIQG